MIARLALLFTLVTLLELSLLIPLGEAVGLPATIAIVIATAVVGATLAKRQGVTIWNRIQQELGSGKLPRDSLLDGLAVLVAGAFLLTPGVLTDVVGILLLIPPARVPLKALAKRYAKKILDSPDVTYVEMGTAVEQSGADPAGGSARPPSPDEDVIDVEPVDSNASEPDPDRDPEDDNRVDYVGELSTSHD